MRFVAPTIIAIGASALLYSSAGRGADTSPSTEEVTYIDIVGVGSISDDLVERVALHVEKNLGTDVRRLNRVDSAGAPDLESEAKPLEPLLKADTFALIALILPHEKVTEPNVRCFPETRIGLVNARGLMPKLDDDEQYGRRLEKEAIAAIAAIAGLQPNPVPDCATFRYLDEAGLDLKGRNLSPPQLLNFRRQAKEARLAGHVSNDAPDATLPTPSKGPPS